MENPRKNIKTKVHSQKVIFSQKKTKNETKRKWMIGGSKWYKSRKRHITTADASQSIMINEESQKYKKN